jgi:SAM-dependent methyltransferase
MYSGAENLEIMKEAVTYNRFLRSAILRQQRPGDKLLDFGAGIGTFAIPLKNDGADIACVEPDPTFGRHLRDSGLHVYRDIEDVPPDSANFIYTLNVLEHIPDDEAAIRALVRRLAPGGRLLVYVPAFNILFSDMDRRVGHVRRYRKRALVASLERCGANVVQARYVDSIGFAAALLYRVVANGTGALSSRSVALYDRWIFPVSVVLDRLTSRWIGKNLLVLATRKAK